MQNIKKKLSIHGHFYQPPRLDPMIMKYRDDDAVVAWSQGKFRNWNEAINAECYKPNADLGNFDLISFDMYRSLAQWLCEYDRSTYDKIINADKHNFITYGYGNAIGYAYDHAILPLLGEEDIELEVAWGMADFFKRYGHMPVSLWLPETGVDLKTLRILGKYGIRFVILAPWQVDTEGKQLDVSTLYKCSLGHGKVMNIFVYDGELSGDLSFNNVQMADANKYVSEYLPGAIHNDFSLAATDGERYGHHLKGGEHFLKQMLRDLFNNSSIETANVVQEFFNSQSTESIKIFDNSAWSCHHGGLKRWQGDCDCSYDDTHGVRTNGYWKTALLSAFRVLSAQMELYLSEYAKIMISDLRILKLEYIHVMQGEIDFTVFIENHLIRPVTFEEERKLKALLDMQQYRLAMFTSDAFYFADLDRPESRINIQNAKKALSLLKDIGEIELMERLQKDFLHQIEEIYSNFTGKNGKDLYYEDGISL